MSNETESLSLSSTSLPPQIQTLQFDLRTLVSSHHGSAFPNQLLLAIQLFDSRDDISLLEIDVCYDGTRFVTSHDYSPASMALGSSLPEWFDAFLPRGIRLWLDIKDSINPLTVFCGCCSVFPVAPFVALLAAERDRWLEKGIHLEQRIIIGSQNASLYDALSATTLAHEFILMSDQPLIGAYMCQIACCCSGACCCRSCFELCVQWRMRSSIERERRRVVSLDRTFFADTLAVQQFVDSLAPALDLAIVGPYSPSEAVPSSKTHRVAVQYNFPAVESTTRS